MTCSAPASSAARAIGASWTNWGRAPTTDRIFTPASVGAYAVRRRRAPSLGRMRILVATTWFPSPGHPQVGAFVARDVAALAARHEVRVLHLVAPAFAQDDDARRGPGISADGGGLGRPSPPTGRGSALGTESTQVLDSPGMAPVAIRVRRVVTDLRRPDHLVRAGRAIVSAARGADVLHTAAFSTLLPLAGRKVSVPWVHTEHWHGVTST